MISRNEGNNNENKKRRLLIIDDEPDITSILTMTLKDHFVIDAYNDPMHVITNFKPNLYDIVLVDYSMSSMNGIELVNIIRRIDSNLRFLIMTAFEPGFLNKKEEAEQKNVGNLVESMIAQDCIIQKPFTNEELLTKLNLILFFNNDDQCFKLATNQLPNNNTQV